MRDALRDAPLPVRFAHCPDHATTQNVVSLHRALALAPDGRDVVKLDGDVAFDGAVLARLIAAVDDAAAAVDDGATPPAEAMKVTVDGTGASRASARASRRRRRRASRSASSASPRGASPRSSRPLARAVDAGRTDVYYEDVYNDLIAAGLAMRAARVSSLRWCEVDDLDDLAAARRLFAGG